MKTLIRYEILISGRWTSLLSCLGIAAYALLPRLLWGRYFDELSPGMLLEAFVILLPLVSGLAAAHLMSIESEVRFDEIRLTYPEPRFRLPLARTLMALALILLAMSFGILAFIGLWGLPDFNPWLYLLPAIPASVFLTGFSMLVSGLFRSYWAAAALVMGWWFLELQTRGQVTGILFLFYPIWPNADNPVALHQWALLVAGAGFFIINLILYASQVNRRLRENEYRTR